MAWITPKTDWTTEDYYNYGDLNRVENNTDYLKTELNNLGYLPSINTINTARDNTTIEFYDSLNRVESNIKALKDSSYEPLSWITPQTDWASVSQPFSYIDANRLENNLLNFKTMVDRLKEDIRYCGTFYSGDTFGDIFSDWGCL
jgi:hypothetical protein